MYVNFIFFLTFILFVIFDVKLLWRINPWKKHKKNYVNWWDGETGGIYTLSDLYDHLNDEMQDQARAASAIVLAHVQSSDHSVFRAIILHYHIQLLSLYNSCIKSQDISQDSMPLQHTMIALNRASFVRVLFYLQLLYRMHEYFVLLLVRQWWKGLK